MRAFLFFIDGMGLGPEDPAINPMMAAEMVAFESLLGGQKLWAGSVPYRAHGAAAVATDACLGVEGLPQSATGQTAIFTGQNAARAIGRHLNAYPTPSLKKILCEHSIFKQVGDRGLTATFLNGFRPQFFDWVAAGQPTLPDRRYRPSASTVAALAAGIHTFRTVDQIRQGEAVGFDIDHHVMRAMGFDLDPVTPQEAGRRAARVAARHHFTLYEHFLTDKAGHARDQQEAVKVLERVDQFLQGVLEELPEDHLLVITSDHGNIEDLSVKTHTKNKVPTIIKGPGAEGMADQIESLTDITPAIIRALG
ncbi:MAG: alkaline phosphatase family protein [Bacillota bacterium]